MRLRTNIIRGAAPTAATAVILCAAGGAAHAAEEASKPAEEVQEIIITGTAGGAELAKQQASFSITTVSAEQIEAVAPKSSAELLVQIPSVWVESSGGVAGANITLLGFPDAGDAPHVTFEINGAPIYPTETLSFMEHSSLFRLDETIAGVEGELGGPSSVFGRGETGLTANFRLKEGGEKSAGVVKYTTSDYRLQRVDMELSGKLSEDLYYMIGGYASSSPGIRDTQFTSEKGQQFTINLTRKFENGRINVWSRYTDDHGQWILPMYPGSGNNLGTFAQLGNYSRFYQLQVGVQPGPNGTTLPIYQQFDFSKGRGWDGTVSGMNADFRLSDSVALRDNLSFTKGNADTYGLVPDGSAVQVASLPADPVTNRPAGTATTAHGVVLAGTDWVQNYGFWVVQKALRSVTNDFSLALKAGDSNDVTVGYYAASWSSDDFWTLGNFVPFQNVANGDLLSSTTTCADLQAAGSNSGCWHYGIRSSGDATARAGYLADSWRVTEALRIDVGVRREYDTVDYTVDAGPGYPTGNVANEKVFHSSDSDNAYTAAVDYEFDDHNGVFARYTHGFKYPGFDDFRGGAPQIQKLNLAEAGYKHTEHLWKLYATAFRDTVDENAGTPGSANVSSLTPFKSKAYGLQVDGTISFDAGPGLFKVRGLGTFQHATYDDIGDPLAVGKKIIRQPDTRFVLNPSYTMPLGTWNGGIYGSAEFIGSRFLDQDNKVQVGAYTTVALGAELTAPWNMTFRVYGENVTDRHDPTEGDPRAVPPANYRPILGRSVQFSVAYNF